MGGIYNLCGRINTLGISLGTGGNIPSRLLKFQVSRFSCQVADRFDNVKTGTRNQTPPGQRETRTSQTPYCVPLLSYVGPTWQRKMFIVLRRLPLSSRLQLC